MYVSENRGTTWPVHLSTDQPNVAFDPAVVQKPATKGGVAIVTVKTLLESAIEHISEHIRLIEIRVVDDDGEPFVHREMIEVAPDGSRRRLRTDHEGRFHARHDAMLSAEENEDAAAIEAFPVFKLAIEQ